ncbi:MAG: hypothetical protein RL026_2574, partial [Pseudomonadota bacterium]
ALAQEYARQVERRVELGDSAPVDANAAQAAASRARAQLLEAEGAVALARRTALEAFPSLSLREPRQWPDPVLPAGPADSWIDRIRGHNHEIDMGDSAAAAASLDARRARQDRLPDPRIVVHFSNNFDQDRRQLGLEVSIPLGGARRRHAATLEAGRAERAALEAEQVRRRVGMEAEDLVADASRRHERWQALASAADLAQALARRTQRGQELGEYTVADVVLARSRAGEAALAQALAALDAHESSIRVRIDAHTLWTPDTHEDHEP